MNFTLLPVQPPSRWVSPVPPAVAGPGPATLAAQAARAWISATSGQICWPLGFANLDAEGDDNPAAANAVDGALKELLEEMANEESGGESGGALQGIGKGKGKAMGSVRPGGQDRLSPLTDSTDPDNKVIHVQRRPPPKAQPGKHQTRRIEPSGEFHSPACVRCRRARFLIQCEKDANGGACIPCKRKKQGCSYAVVHRRTQQPRRPVKSKPVVESEDADGSASETALSDRPLPPPRRAPPPRDARTRATAAI
jgi:hypothetical protein